MRRATVAARQLPYEASVAVQAPATELERRPWLGGTVERIDDEHSLLRTGDEDLTNSTPSDHGRHRSIRPVDTGVPHGS